jgi:hypothetical protein
LSLTRLGAVTPASRLPPPRLVQCRRAVYQQVLRCFLPARRLSNCSRSPCPTSWVRRQAASTDSSELSIPSTCGAGPYLAEHQGTKDAAEYQKVLDHRGIVLSDPIGAVAHLQLSRALASLGHRTNAKLAYQDFLMLTKDADPETPILKRARAEFADLK